MAEQLDKIYQADALQFMQRIRDGVINCVITSPPY